MKWFIRRSSWGAPRFDCWCFAAPNKSLEPTHDPARLSSTFKNKMNIEVESSVETPRKPRLRRRVIVRVATWILPILIAALILLEIIPFWFIAIVMLLWLFDLLPESYFLTSEYIQRGTKKLLYSELEDVRSLLYWYIITDHYGESIWIPWIFLEPEDRNILNKWLGLDRENQTEQAGRRK